MIKRIPRIILAIVLTAVGASTTRSAWSATLLPDMYESPNGNETRDFATDLSSFGSGTILLDDLTIHRSGDVDYFKWSPVTNMTVQIDALFDHRPGHDLDLLLREFSLATIERADSTNDNEQIIQQVVGGQDYLIKVFGFGSSTNQYDLSITTAGTSGTGGGGDGGSSGGGDGGGSGGTPTPPPRPPISTNAGRMLSDLLDTLEGRDMYARAHNYYMVQLNEALKSLNVGASAQTVLRPLDKANTMLMVYRRRLSQDDLALLYASIREIVQELVPTRWENTRVRRALFPRGIPSNFAAIQPQGELGDGQASVGYDANTGEVWVDAPAGTELSAINIDSAANIFTGDPAQNLGGSFDNSTADNIFKATFGNVFGSLSFGNVAQPGLTEEFLLSDLTVIGSLADGGDLGAVDLVFVPEPSTWALTSICLLGFLACGWVRRPSAA